MRLRYVLGAILCFASLAAILVVISSDRSQETIEQILRLQSAAVGEPGDIPFDMRPFIRDEGFKSFIEDVPRNISSVNRVVVVVMQSNPDRGHYSALLIDLPENELATAKLYARGSDSVDVKISSSQREVIESSVEGLSFAALPPAEKHVIAGGTSVKIIVRSNGRSVMQTSYGSTPNEVQLWLQELKLLEQTS